MYPFLSLVSYALTPEIYANTSCANAQQLATIIDEMAASPTSEMIEGLRMLERKTSLVFTLLKASVYGIVLQQECFGEGEG